VPFQVSRERDRKYCRDHVEKIAPPGAARSGSQGGKSPSQAPSKHGSDFGMCQLFFALFAVKKEFGRDEWVYVYAYPESIWRKGQKAA
jgi:hypothetical protein